MHSGKKKILVMVEWFAPGYKAGGPIQSCVNLCKALGDAYQMYVLTTDTDHGSTVPYPGIQQDQWIINESIGCQVLYLSAMEKKADRIKRIIQDLRPDFLYLNLLFSPLFVIYPLWLKWKGVIAAKVVVCPRGCLYESALNVKRYKKMPLLWLYRRMGIKKSVLFHATNTREAGAIERYFPGAKSIVANNLPAMIQRPFQSCIKMLGQLKCIFVGRIVPIKNLHFVLQCLQQTDANILLTIAGPAEDATYWQACQTLIGQLPANIQCNYIGPVEHDALQDLLQAHHLFVLPSTGENFGHSIFESMLAGRPVLISDQTPWQQLQQVRAGWDLPLQQPRQFEAVLEQLAASDEAMYNDLAVSTWQFAADFLQQPGLKEPYFRLFQ